MLKFFYANVLSLFALVCLSASAQVVIHEMMYHPASLNSDDEFIELFNYSKSEVDISGWAFTDGIHYIFPGGTIIGANDYLVVSASPGALFQQYGIETPYGPYAGKLNNDGETVELTRFNGSIADSVTYVDELGWPTNADGLGPSLERLHPEMESSVANTWRSPPGLGTPGQRNSAQLDEPVPLVTDIIQTPASPKSTDAVFIRARISHSRSLNSVGVFFKTEDDTEFRWTPMLDDGLHNDGAAGDNLFGAELPAYPHGTVVEFRILALDENEQQGWFPLIQTAPSAIYRVDDVVHETTLPMYKIVMRAQDEIALRTRDPRSNDEISASFIHGNDIYYRVGVRFRGKGSRFAEPKNYRVNFPTTRYFGKTRKLILNSVKVDRQYIGLECFDRLGLPAPKKQFVAVDFNGVMVPRYLEVERTDSDMMRRLFGDGDGNLYRGVEQANLDYRGEEFGPYIPHYTKETNSLRGDYSDIVRLCEAFTLTTDDEFPERIEERIHLRQWIRWFALKQVLNDREGGLSRERGDDYYIYRFEEESRFYLLPWDLDSVLVQPFENVHHHGTPAVRRLLRHPDLARLYYQEILNILDVELTPEVMQSIIDKTAVVNEEAQRIDLMAHFLVMRDINHSQIPQIFTAEVSTLQTQRNVLVDANDDWQYFRGTEHPSSGLLGWTQLSYNDSHWRTGPGGFGYGDGDDRTLLFTMRDAYSSVFIRKKFVIEDVSSIAGLELSVLFDDGFVAYINGVEIKRNNFSRAPFYDQVADGNHEASEFELFNLDDSIQFLQPGENVLAIVGFNVKRTSSDFSLAANLFSKTSDNDTTRLSGLADAIHTKRITVNGAPAKYEPWLGQWAYETILNDGRHVFDIRALSDAGLVVDSTQIIVYQNAVPPTGVTEVSGDLVWRKADSPMLVTQTVWVPPESSLTIESGAEVRFASGAAIWVQGAISTGANGDEPITMVSNEPGQLWDGIVIEDASSLATIQSLNITGAGSAKIEGRTYPGVITVLNSAAQIESCLFFDLNSVGVDAINSTIHIIRNEFKNMVEAVHCTNSFASIVGNRFINILGYSDAIDFDGGTAKPSIISDNVIMGSEDDGIDLGFSNARIERNLIHGCADKGVSLEGDSAPVVINNIIENCDIAIAVKDRCAAYVAHNTIYGAATGVSVFEKNPGQGGATATIFNSVIWNTNQSVLVDDKSSVILRTNNLSPLAEFADETNFSLDPMFINTGERVFFPQRGSPLIDAAEPTDITVDIGMRPRPNGAAPDIGAIESEFTTSIRDWPLLH